MIFDILKVFVLFTDISVVLYCIYLIVTTIYKILSPNYINVMSYDSIKYYTDILKNNIDNNISGLSNIENINELCDFNVINNISNKWIHTRYLKLCDESKNVSIYNTFLNIHDSIRKDVKECSELIINNINNTLKSKDCDIRLIYDLYNDCGITDICKLQKYILRVNADIVLYELITNEMDTKKYTAYYILHDESLYRHINILMFDMVNTSIETIDIFDEPGVYIKIIINNDNVYPTRYDIKLLLSDYYQQFNYIHSEDSEHSD